MNFSVSDKVSTIPHQLTTCELLVTHHYKLLLETFTMPYYWQRIKDMYDDHHNSDSEWRNAPHAIVGDLAWHFIDEDDTPQALQRIIYECDEHDQHHAPSSWRLPYPDENCEFKKWIDRITASEVSQGWRDKLMYTLFADQDCTLTDAEASCILHLAPCSVIQSFIQKTQQIIDDYNQSEASYQSDETIEAGETQQYMGSGLVNRPDSDEESSDDEGNDWPGWRQDNNNQDARELRSNQWENIQFPWQHHTTPRQYYEIIEGYPYSGEEDMEISDEDDLPPLENLAPLVLQRQVAFVLPRA